MYEAGVESLTLRLADGNEYQFPEMLSNGRANYILFEELVRNLTGLSKTKQSDHIADDGTTYEQKAYSDQSLYPTDKSDLFQTSASSTFGANNNGPIIKRLLENGQYQEALEICKATGYSKNDFYIYTNTKNYKIESLFRYFVLPTKRILELIDSDDPRLISRSVLLAQIKGLKKLT